MKNDSTLKKYVNIIFMNLANMRKGSSRVIKIFLCLALWVFLGAKPMDASFHPEDNIPKTECCWVCHPAHHVFLNDEMTSPNFSLKAVDLASQQVLLPTLEILVKPIFHPPKTSV